MLLGKFTQNFENNELYDSIDCSSNNKNVFLNSKVICGKEEKREKILYLIEKSYDALKNAKRNPQNNSFYYLYFIFNREVNLSNNNATAKNLNCKIYTIFPNVNFELSQIKNLSFSNTKLNQMLVSKNFKAEEIPKSGFFTLSSNHRLIALKDDTLENGNIKNSQSLKQIIFGIWINLKEEKPTPKKHDLDNLIEKHKTLIYKKCFDFIQITSKIESVFSPSPDQGVFILVLFYHGMQCHYEVKMMPNEEDKNFFNSEMRPLSNFGCNWILSKTKFTPTCDENIEFNLKNECENSNFIPVSDYIAKKTGTNQLSFLTKSTNTKLTSSKISNVNYPDNILEMFENTNLEIEDLDDELYNYPLIMPQKPNNKKSESSIIQDVSKQSNPTTSTNSKKQIEISHSSINSHSIKNNNNLNNSKNSKNSQISNANTTSNTGDSQIAFQNATAIVIEHTKNIQDLHSQISRLELNIKNVINELMASPKDQSKLLKKEKQNKSKHTDDISKENEKSFDNNNNDISKIVDKSLKVPKIIYHEIDNEDDDDDV